MAERSMIERIARALCRHDGHAENIKMDGKPMWESYRSDALAVLHAIREPTRFMEGEAAAYRYLGIGSHSCAAEWTRMVDAALTEAQP